MASPSGQGSPTGGGSGSGQAEQMLMQMLQQQQPQTPLHEAAAEQLPDVQPSELVAALQGSGQIGGGMSSKVATQP